MQPNIVSNLPCQQRMLLRRIIPNQQNRRGAEYIPHAGGCVGFSRQRGRKSWEVSRAVMINVVGLQHDASELLQQVVFFVGRASRTVNSNRLPTMHGADCRETIPHKFKCFFPRGRR